MTEKRLVASRSRVRLEDLARAANVSISTVSLALRGDPAITPETRERIVTLGNELGYVPLRQGRSSSGRNRIVFVLQNRSFELDPYNSILDGALEGCGLAQCELSMANSLEKELFKDGEMPNGIVLAGDLEEGALSHCIQRDVPVVVAGSHFFSRACNGVQIDLFAAAVLSVQRAVADGAKGFAYLASDLDTFFGWHYLACLRIALERLGFGLSDENVFLGAQSSPVLALEVSDRISRQAGVDAIFTNGQDHADLCYAVLLRDADAPRIYSLSASGSVERARHYACLDIGQRRVGRIAVRRLRDLIEGGAGGESEPYSCMLPPVGWLDGY